MARAILLALQAASMLAAAPDQRLVQPVAPAPDCHASSAAIVVCGKDRNSYRLPQPGPPPDAKAPAKAEWGLFGDTKMGMHGTERTSRGVSDPAAMVTITMPF